MGTMKLKDARIRMGANLSEVANKLSVSVPTLCNYENGAALPTIEDMVNAENLFNKKLDWSLSETIDGEARQTIISAFNALSQRYPLQAVLNFMLRSIKSDQKSGKPDRMISYYASRSYRIQPMLLPGVKCSECD